MKNILWGVALVWVGCGDPAQDPSPSPGTLDAGSTDAAPDSGEPLVRDARVHFLVDTEPDQPGGGTLETTMARYGDAIHVTVDGLLPGETVRLVFGSGAGQSQGVFTADPSGTVDASRQAPQDGSSWSTAHEDGFLWSMTNPPTGPLDLTVRVEVWAGDPEVQVSSGELQRRYINADIVTLPVRMGRTRGLLASPNGSGPWGGVLCFGGSEGGTSTGEWCAMYWASMGYAALGVGYFGAPGLPADLDEVPLELLEEDLAYLTGQPNVLDDRVVVMGGSRGGELALLLGATFPVVKGVVAQVPSGYVWGALSTDARSGWTYQGEPLPNLPADGSQVVRGTSSEGVEGLVLGGIFSGGVALATEEQKRAARIRAENTQGPVLLLSAADDQLWPGCLLAQTAWDSLQATGHAQTHGDEYLCEPGAGHAAVAVPGWSTEGSTSGDVGGDTLILGGTPEGNSRAARHMDTRTRALLRRVLGAPAPFQAP